MKAIRLGFIGFGARAAAVAVAFRRVNAAVTVSAVADPSPETSRYHMKAHDIPWESTVFVPTAEELLCQCGGLDGVVVATRCDLHAGLAVQAAASGLPLFLEKPVGITETDLRQLAAVATQIGRRTVVSFPLRLTPLLERVHAIVASGCLGTINQIQAYNYVPYGGVYFGQWYRDERTTGSLWLQKATHDFDYLVRLAGAAPVSVAATSSKRIYAGQQPSQLVCSGCPENGRCPESPSVAVLRGDDGGMGREDHACPFGTDARHHDAATALIRFGNGVHASYAQNFISRRSAARRGARVTGYLATLDFDFCAEMVTVTEHHDTAVIHEHVPALAGHHGGDTALARNYLNVIHGTETSKATLEDGILSARMCLAAMRSEASDRFVSLSEVGV